VPLALPDMKATDAAAFYPHKLALVHPDQLVG
jgi:hypothetical protein